MFVRSFVRPCVRSSVTSFSRGIGSLVFSDFWHEGAKWQCPKCDGVRFSKNIFFQAENAGNMPEKPVFWHILEISSLVFSDFLQKDLFEQCPNEVRFLRILFFRPKMPEIAVFPDFLYSCLWYFFSHKILLIQSGSKYFENLDYFLVFRNLKFGRESRFCAISLI